VAAIPFENVDVVLGSVPALDIPSLQKKMVRRARGGYCYEQNLLYAAALDQLGIPVTRLAARVRMGSSAPRPRSHMMLLAEADGEGWLTDVGFGGGGLLEPMPLREHTMRQGDWTFRLTRDDEEWILQSKTPAGWFDLYSFAMERQFPADYETYNWFTAANPKSPFVGHLVIQATGPETRRTLVGTELTIAGPDGVRERRTLTPDETLDALSEEFGIKLTPDERDRLYPIIAG
jgi:N-hydroxyarylamine O-acetyltransferase